MALNDHTYVKEDFKLSDYAERLDSVSKERYLAKLTIQKTDDLSYFRLQDPYLINKDLWKDDASLWPKITEADIRNYIASGPGRNSKSLSAYEYVVSGKVQAVKAFIPQEMPGIIILFTLVQPSQRCNAECYRAWVICKTSGVIKSGHCTCLAGLGEVCSHIAALLYKVQLGVSVGIASTSTEKRCEWNNSFTRKVKAVPLNEIKFKRTKWAKQTSDAAVCQPTCNSIPPITKEQMQDLKNIVPDAVYFTTLVDSSSTDTASENDENEALPPTILDIIKISKINCNEDLKKFFTPENIENLEKVTRDQGNQLWFKHRCGRVTSSNFGSVIKKKNFSGEFINLFTTISPSLNVPSVKWGRSKEKIAFRAYFKLSKVSHLNFQLRQAGLFISHDDPYLASSPDGVVECDCCGKGILEIKCPFKHRKEHPQNIPCIDKNFYLDANGTLKKQHSYYAQIQGQMAITNRDYCDLIVWTTVDLYKTRILRDTQYWDNQKPVLKSFFFNHVIPSLVNKS